MPSDRPPHSLPEFDSVEDERRHRKQRLAAAFRLFGTFGFERGRGRAHHRPRPRAPRPLLGQPVRRRLQPDHGVGPASSSTTTARSSRATAPVNAGRLRHPLAGPRRPPRRAWPRPTPTRSTARRSRRSAELLDPITQDACAFYDDHALFDDYTGVVLDTEEGKRIAHALGDNKAAILRNHGLLTVGHTRRRGGVVVHHHGALLPGPAAGQAAGTPVLDRPRDGHAHRRRQVGCHLAGLASASSRCTSRSSAAQPDLLD